jgi:hypothetical protein
VYVSIANGTDEPLVQSQSEIFVKGQDGNRVPAVPLTEATEQRAQEQIETLTLKAGTVPPNGTASGYVFYPHGEYRQIEAILGNTETQSSIMVVNTVRR